MRCSTTSGLQGRSNSTRRRQNSKLRPSPPHSVETRRLGPPGQAELGHLDVAPRRGQPLVEDAGRQLGAAAELRPQPLERLAVGDEDEGLLARVPPRGRLPGEPREARVRRVRPLGEPAERRVSSPRGEPAGRPPRRARGAPGRPSGGGRARGARVRPGPPRPGPAARASRPGSRRGCRRAGAGRRCPRGASRSCREAGALCRASRASNVSSSGKSAGRRSWRSRKKPCTSSSSGIAVRRRRCRPRAAIGADRAPGGASRVPGRAAQPVGLVHHEEVDARLHRAGGELGPRDERLEGDHRAPVDVEGVEVGAVVPDHVGEPRVVEQHEDLVVLPPELAEPLDGERLGGDHEAPLRAPRPDEAAQDEAGLDRLPEADLVGQEPAHGVRGGGALGRVKLVGEQPDAAAEEGAEARGLAQRGEVQGVEAEGEVLDRVDLARGEPLHEVGPGVERAGVARGERQEGRPVGGEAQRLSRGGELHDERPAVDRDHVPDPELRVVAVGETVADLPGGPHAVHCISRGRWGHSLAARAGLVQQRAEVGAGGERGEERVLRDEDQEGRPRPLALTQGPEGAVALPGQDAGADPVDGRGTAPRQRRRHWSSRIAVPGPPRARAASRVRPVAARHSARPWRAAPRRALEARAFSNAGIASAQRPEAARPRACRKSTPASGSTSAADWRSPTLSGKRPCAWRARASAIRDGSSPGAASNARRISASAAGASRSNSRRTRPPARSVAASRGAIARARAAACACGRLRSFLASCQGEAAQARGPGPRGPGRSRARAPRPSRMRRGRPRRTPRPRRASGTRRAGRGGGPGERRRGRRGRGGRAAGGLPRRFAAFAIRASAPDRTW